ncbi:1-aminocyclopropane-1-carboxylate synthase-like protein 1 isoform X1 [Hippocampus zosterae]|uniref:1-aminocyclopropane-1-carboxylate synthase-like protein 1 isoform X1 n=1 Tax=Hippocampus zosterae TaxID=109293 RepID=UPI00223DAFA8|nr:1-aminocyclopropane-1-carboxylate synthase-like protein 1 isoform X1 [Hippocampus zosterae]XP_051916006.1 1-aminocyclopropane-1-carboxylate synthase-like protein 1 isoform X1 [Hippocampus zosterae]
MDPRCRRHERGSNWTDQEIVELLQLWSEDSIQIELESSLRNQRVFDRIALILREKGMFRTGDQCREKIKKMKLEYRRIKDNHKSRSWKFYDVMDRVLANRPALTSSTQGETFDAQQLFQSPDRSDSLLQGNSSLGSFGPATLGGFLFGQPPKTEDPLDVKCEDAEEILLNTDVAQPDLCYRSGDEQETDGRSLLGTEDILAQGDNSAFSKISPSGNVPVPHDTSQESLPSPAATKQRRRRKAGKNVCGNGGGKCCSQGPLNKALANLLVWQQCAEDRLVSWEKARLEKELQADERRQQQEEKRAERERQHELHLFNLLTGALTAARHGAATTKTAPTNTAVSLLDHQSALLATSTASSAPSSSQPRTQAPSALSVSTKATMKSELHPSVKTFTSSESVLATTKSPEASVYLSNRGNSIRQQQGILQAGFAHYGANKYDIDNPDGVINLGTSENKLCYDLLHKRLTRSDMLHVDPALLQYGDWRGHTFLREAVAKFLTHYCRSPKLLKADNVVVMNGCSALFSCIAAVICDAKDAILIPSPFYGAITEDVQLYSDVKLFHAPLESEDGNEDGRLFHLTVSKLEEAMQRAKQQGVNIRAIILMNPHNPLAEIYTPNEMLSFLQFAKRNEIHAIIDEVYMLTVFDESVTFHSVLSLESLPDPQRTHIMWGLSKDFAMAGNRVGTLYTENQDLVEALTKLGSFHGVTGTSQHQVAQLLQDREWISKEFLPENRRRLKAAHGYLTDELQTMDIHYLDSSATLYVWADFRKFLRSPSFEEELYMWRCFLKHNVVLSCGQAFSCCTPGWFRIVFADQQDHLQLGLKRIREALKEMKESSTNRDFFIVKEASEESARPVNLDSAPSDNGTIKNSTSSPQSNSSDQLKEKACSVLDTSSLGPDELVLLDCQAAKPAESLDTLIGTLKHQIRSSDWLEKNTPERSAGADPEILDVFQTLLAQARK